MRKHTWLRALSFFPVLFLLTLSVFGLMRLAPGDPAYVRLTERGIDITEENLEKARQDLGLDRPLWEQYGRWLTRMSRLDFGRSTITGRDVLAGFLDHLEATVALTLPSLLLMALIALPCGVLSAVYAGGWFDRLSRAMSILLSSVPAFCLGLAALLLFGVRLGWLPTFGTGSARHMILPCASLALGAAAGFARFVRSAVLEQLSGDYVRAARARGIPVRVIVVRGALRGALAPILTSLGMTLGLLLGGSAVVETVFSWPGVGKYLVDAIMQHDLPVVQCCVLAFGLFFVTLNFAAEIACMFVDPRTRQVGRALS